MDNGEVIVALNEEWTFAGASLFEWMAGFVTFLISTTMFDKISSYMPVLLMIWVGTTFALAAARKSFPDEEVGLRNALSVALGVTPLGLPAPSCFNPYWSTCPMRDLPKTAHYHTLQLDDIIHFGSPDDETNQVFRPRTTQRG
jgi:hypothetical protein